MKKLCFMSIVMVALTCCNERKVTRQLDIISKIADSNVDSALTLLRDLENEKEDWGEDDRMYYDLLKLKAENKSGVNFTSNSIIRNVAEYYKNKGNANKKMLSYYLLGRTYSDMGEAPEALQAYYDAISAADTTSKTCDFCTMTAVYGQMSRLFHKQNLPHDEIWALTHYIQCVQKYETPKEYIIAKGQLIRPYYLLGEKDSVLKIINDTYLSLKKLGEYQEAADAIVVSISIYLERGDLTKAKQAMDVFENDSKLFDKQGNIAKGRESYYYTKGWYELAVGQIEAAESNFHKAIRYGYLTEGYKGLLFIYREKKNVDSVFYFSQLYEAAQDSLHNKMRTDVVHQMSALYNYSRTQKEMEQEREKTQNSQSLLALTTIVAAVLLIMVILVVRWYHKSQKEKRARIVELEETLDNAKKQRNDVLEELRILKDKDYESIIAIKEEQKAELTRRIEILETENIRNKKTIDDARVDNLEDFLNSNIVQLFIRKAENKSERIRPTELEWNLLVSQFSKDIPVMFKSFGQGKTLSQLEQRICILLILDMPEKIISLMTESQASTISNAKARANEKLYGKKNAHTLKIQLIDALKRS